MKPFRVILDLDSTIFDYDETWLNRLSQKLNVPRSTLGPTAHYDMTKNGWPTINTFSDFINLHNEFVADGMFLDFKAYENSVEVINRLRAKGAYIKVVTKRFCSENPEARRQVVVDTVNSLAAIGLDYDEFMISDRKEDIDAELAIDDSPSNAVKFVKAGIPVLLPSHQFNAEVALAHNIPVFNNWLEAEVLIEAMMEQHAAQQTVSEKVSSLV